MSQNRHKIGTDLECADLGLRIKLVQKHPKHPQNSPKNTPNTQNLYQKTPKNPKIDTKTPKIDTKNTKMSQNRHKIGTDLECADLGLRINLVQKRPPAGVPQADAAVRGAAAGCEEVRLPGGPAIWGGRRHNQRWWIRRKVLEMIGFDSKCAKIGVWRWVLVELER
jgi:hypothetical protein